LLPVKTSCCLAENINETPGMRCSCPMISALIEWSVLEPCQGDFIVVLMSLSLSLSGRGNEAPHLDPISFIRGNQHYVLSQKNLQDANFIWQIFGSC